MQNGMPAQRMWQAVLGQLQLQVTKPVYDTWLTGTRALSLEDGLLSVEAPTPFAVEWLSRRMHQIIVRAICHVSGESLDVEFRVAGSPAVITDQRPTLGQYANPTTHSEGFYLNQHFTFASFVVGPSNHLAFSAAQAVAEAPGRAYNPLFIYSGVGLGKTHLLQAIGHSCAMQGSRVAYVTSEQFTNDFIHGIRYRTTAEFRSRYRGVDLLLIDDIQFISGKEQTQEGFFHTFNDLHTANRQIVLTSDRPPQALSLLEDRLRSRFESGLIADIQAPELETRIAILRSKAEAMQVDVEGSLLDLIAHRTHHSVRELEGALNRVIAVSRLQGRPLTADLASEVFDVTTSDTRKQVSGPDPILDAVARHFRTTPQALRGRQRTKRLAMARHVAMHLMRDMLGMTITDIGRAVGNRDHSTVIHALHKVESSLQQDTSLQSDLDQIRQAIR